MYTRLATTYKLYSGVSAVLYGFITISSFYTSLKIFSSPPSTKMVESVIFIVHTVTIKKRFERVAGDVEENENTANATGEIAEKFVWRSVFLTI